MEAIGMTPRSAAHKRKATPRTRPTYKSRGGDKDFASKTTFNPPATLQGKRAMAQPDVLTDEDRAGKFIGRFGGAGEPPLPHR
jgi:hypothetical protein